MSKARQLSLIMFLALAGGLLPLADVDAWRRCRQAPECSPAEAGAAYTAVPYTVPYTTYPTISGSLFHLTGLGCSDNVKINVWNTPDGINRAMNIGAFPTNSTSYNLTCTGAPQSNNIIIIDFQRTSGTAPLPTGPTTFIVETGTALVNKINPVLP
jgi:hypothetical protein